ncbi:putative quinol monooxygenase [Pelagibacterium halotolerans]|uniref:putative quinol monooxygenase n=1 Tax=Pelagibacterium halotolerans TaxID=531813 RepID=UPI00384ADA90
MIVVEGTIRVRDLQSARSDMEAMINASRAEAGCIDYAYAIDLLDPTLIRVSERWENREALSRHLKTEHIARWRARWDEIGISDRSLRVYDAEPEGF